MSNAKETSFKEYNYDYQYTEKKKQVTKEDDKNVYYANGRRYSKRNKLNELTSKEWLQFQKSFFVFKPKPRKKNVKKHPGKYPDDLVGEFINFFTKRGETVLDPMVGVGSTLIACINNGRNGIGIELQEKYVNIARDSIKEIVNQTKLPIKSVDSTDIHVRLINGDASRIDEMGIKNVDYMISSPPYWDVLREKGVKRHKKRKEKKLDIYYSDDERDLGNIGDYNTFLDTLVLIYEKVCKFLKPKGYMTIIVKNIKKGGDYYPLAWDLAKRMNEFIKLKDERIWCQDDQEIMPYGYPNAWVSNTFHHYCLNFRKEW